MSAAKHTAGPWNVFNVGWIAGADGQTVCALYSMKEPGQHAANAALIAAAPELLVALKKAVETTYSDTLQAEWSALIAKATS